MLSQDLSRIPVFLVRYCHQKMLGRDELVLHPFGLLLRRCEKLTQTRTEVLLTTLNTRKARNSGLNIVKDDLNVNSKLSQDRTNRTFGLLKHGSEQVLWLDLLVLISLCEFNGG